MEISVTDAKAQLTDLVRRAEAGEEVVLTRHGAAVARLTPVTAKPDAAIRAAALRQILADAAELPRSEGPSAARSQDFLYDEDGLPG